MNTVGDLKVPQIARDYMPTYRPSQLVGRMHGAPPLPPQIAFWKTLYYTMLWHTHGLGWNTIFALPEPAKYEG